MPCFYHGPDVRSDTKNLEQMSKAIDCTTPAPVPGGGVAMNPFDATDWAGTPSTATD
jgi:hypothetical protein